VHLHQLEKSAVAKHKASLCHRISLNNSTILSRKARFMCQLIRTGAGIEPHRVPTQPSGRNALNFNCFFPFGVYRVSGGTQCLVIQGELASSSSSLYLGAIGAASLAARLPPMWPTDFGNGDSRHLLLTRLLACYRMKLHLRFITLESGAGTLTWSLIAKIIIFCLIFYLFNPSLISHCFTSWNVVVRICKAKTNSLKLYTQLDATINRKQFFYYFVVQTLLNMFRALLCPSSGARQTAVAASGFRSS
jgi:hypothetical protein